MSTEALGAISAVDGRYAARTRPLAHYMSEKGLMSYRVRVEAEYLIALSNLEGFGPRSLTPEEHETLRKLATLSDADAGIIKAIETKGYEHIPATKHDVKAIEYFIRLKLTGTSLEDISEWIHFGLTSEDVNNLSYALMLRDGVTKALVPSLGAIRTLLENMVREFADLPMLARTHGQPASPTTFGKEMAVFYIRLRRELEKLEAYTILAKLNGATGNYNALIAAAPTIDWPSFTERVIASLNTGERMQLGLNAYTTQIEPHDTYVELFQIISRINTILIDFNQDMWRYISDGWITQKAVEGEVGSSTMPHKVNPIDFENSEGNLGVANSLFTFFAQKLPISRLQRDLSDSTVERTFGLAFAHSLIAYEALRAGLGKVSPNQEAIRAALDSHPEVLAEAIQTILRREGQVTAYEKLMALTRGKAVTLEVLQNFIRELEVSEAVQQELLALTPQTYIGNAATTARNALS